MGSGFAQKFGSTPVAPANPQYQALTIAADQALVWPTETMPGVPFVAEQNDITASAASLQLQMPNAQQGSPGVAGIFTNVGANTFTVTDMNGTQITPISAGQSWIITLINNSTSTGTWRALQLASTTSNATAASLADNETIQASGTNLRVFEAPAALTQDTTITASYRGALVVWDGTFAGTLQLDAVGNLGDGWFADFYNNSTNNVTITTTASAIILVAGQELATLTLGPGQNGRIVCDGTQFYGLFFPLQATSAIAAPVSLGAVVGTTESVAIITTIAVPAGALVVVCVNDSSTSQGTLSVQDSASQTYTLATSASPDNTAADGVVGLYFFYNTAALPIGSTITYKNTNPSGADVTVSAVYATGVLATSSPLDAAASAYGSSTTPSVTIDLSVENELCIGWVGSNTAVDPVQAPGWNTPPSPGAAGATALGGFIFSATSTSETYDPTLGTTGVWAVVAAAFKPGF